MLILRTGLVVGLATAVVGCSSSVAPGKVKGTVTFNGQPLKAGTVYFTYEQGGHQYRAEIKSDGTYQFSDIPAGIVVVTFDNSAFNPEQKSPSYSTMGQKYAKGVSKNINEYNAMAGKDHAGGKAEGDNKDAVALSKEEKEKLAKVYVKLPKKYTSEKTSPLTFSVERGWQTKDFDLSD
jgi:hypothetical protein